MTNERYKQLMESDLPLTETERNDGWHFCREWDGLLVGPKMEELCPCHCLPPEHLVYKTRPPQPEDEEQQLEDL